MNLGVLYDSSKGLFRFRNENEEHEIKISANIRRKFEKHVMIYIKELIEEFDDELKSMYFELLKNPNLDLAKEFIEATKDVIISYTYKLIEKYGIKHKVERKKGYKIIFTDEHIRQITIFSTAIKILSPIIFSHELMRDNSELTNQIYKTCLETYLDKETIDIVMRYITNSVNNTIKTRPFMWTYLDKVNKTEFFHMIDIFNTLMKNMMILMDISASNNVMGYITGFINQAHYYLFSVPMTEETITSLDPAKIKYINNYEILRRTTLHITLDNIIIPFIKKKLQALVKTYALSDKAYSVLLEQFKIKPRTFHQRGNFINPISRYITLPILEKLFNVPFYYLTEYKWMRYLEGYVSLLLTSKFRLLYLGKLVRSIILDKSPRKISFNKRYIDELYKTQHELDDLFRVRKFYFNVFNEVKNYLYHDPIFNDAYVVDPELFLTELHLFYKGFFSKTFDEVIEEIRRHNFLPPEIKNAKLTLTTQLAI